MLVAEIHGKIVPEAQGIEDYLTSAVFGHLRYIPPRTFWGDLFSRAKSSLAHGPSLSDLLSSQQHPVDGYSELRVQFWQLYEEHGEPDMLLRFAGQGVPVLHLLVEAKLWSGKSGAGENDQLVRYLQVLDELAQSEMATSSVGCQYLLYLTPRDSSDEIEDSLKQVADPEKERKRIFRLQWQDVLDAARKEGPNTEEPTRTILDDVALFLERRGLEYFRGFRRLSPSPSFEIYRRAFFESGEVFSRLPSLPKLTPQRAGWING